MYEDITYENILQRMIDRIKTSFPQLDTRKGSFVYIALAPAAVELQNMYIQLDTILKESFADTQSRDYLIKRCAERGVNVRKATYALRKGEFNVDVPLGSRFSLNLLDYAVVEKISTGEFVLRCETAGNSGNTESGRLIPIDYIDGLEIAKLTDVLVPGEDEEDTEHLRRRYFESLNAQSFGGNIADYKEKVNAIDGVGGVKVYPVWNGGGTVKLVIISSDYGVPSKTLLDNVQTIIDPTQNKGVGAGLAPIGHIVTVVGCTSTLVNVDTKITFKDEWNWAVTENHIKKAITDYFKELATQWSSSDKLIIRISQIENRLLGLTGVLDITDTQLNGRAENLILGADDIPTIGVIKNIQ